MAKELKCADVGFDCDATMQGNSEDEVMSQAAAHAKSVHGLSDQDLEQQSGAIRAAIHDI
jgi:predicted small metal-binding protein